MTDEAWNQKRFDRGFEAAREAARFGDMKESRRLYRALLASKPQGFHNRGMILLNLGQVEHHEGNIGRGIKLMEAALRVFPGCIWTYNSLSGAYKQQKQYHKLVCLKLLYIRNVKSIYQALQPFSDLDNE